MIEHKDGAGDLPDKAGPDSGSDEEDGAQRVPAVDDVIMQSLGERWETTREMLSYPAELANAIPRAVLTKDESVDLLRTSVLDTVWEHDDWDPLQLAWEKMALSIPVDGRGRAEAVQIATSGAFLRSQARETRDGPREAPRGVPR